jgi:hypothetical protein
MAETNKTVEKLKDILSDPQQLERLAPLLDLLLSKGASEEGKSEKKLEAEGARAPGKSQEFSEAPDVFEKADDSENKFLQEFSRGAENNGGNCRSNVSAGLNLDTITKVKTLYDRVNAQDDPRINLLTAIRPYMRENKHSKIDMAMKILRVTKIGAAMKELDVL